MPTVQILPDSNQLVVPTWTLGPFEEIWSNLAELTDVKEARANDVGTSEVIMGMADVPGSVSRGFVEKITIHSRGKRTTGAGFASYKQDVRVEGSVVRSVLIVSGATYTTNSIDWTTNPISGLPWTWEELDALEAGLFFDSANMGNRIDFTQFWIDIIHRNAIYPYWYFV